MGHHTGRCMCGSEGHLGCLCCERVTLMEGIGDDSLMMIAEIYYNFIIIPRKIPIDVVKFKLVTTTLMQIVNLKKVVNLFNSVSSQLCKY